MTEKTFTIISDYNLVGQLVDDINNFLNEEKAEAHIRNAVTICLTEGVNNVIKHSYKGEPGNTVEVQVRKNNNLLEINIVDEGAPRANLEVRELNFDPEDIDSLPESGMGLFIIKQLMDEMSYYSINGKNYFSLKKWLI